MRRRAGLATLFAVVIKQGDVAVRVVMRKRSIRRWSAAGGRGGVGGWCWACWAAAATCRVSLPFTSSAQQRDQRAVRAVASASAFPSNL